jgi:bifunctional UDP-N-acetylglucosamine pyrophosphorylase / glucosamine-1-phosphate N-acetyltransferase
MPERVGCAGLPAAVRPGTRGQVEPGAFISGDVEVAEGARVEAGAYIRGPAIIGAGTEVRHAAYIRGPVLTLAGCVVGHASECKNSILLDGSKAPHFAYVGDSVVGRNVNLAAGVRLANIKVTPGAVAIRRPDGTTADTGLRKLGALVGDDTQIGCNTVTSPGIVIGPGWVIYPGISLQGTVPPRSVVAWRPELEIRPRREPAG